jgi:hypothetical protein
MAMSVVHVAVGPLGGACASAVNGYTRGGTARRAGSSVLGMTTSFTGWGPDATAFLAAIAADNTPVFWAAHRERFESALRAPLRALAAALEPEFGPLRLLRPRVDRRFRPDAPPYRTDVGGVAVGPGGCELGVVLSAGALTATAGHRRFDAGQRRRFRAAVADERAGPELEELLPGAGGVPGAADRIAERAAARRGGGPTGRVGAALVVLPGPALVGRPRGVPADHPRVDLLRHLGLQVGASWPVGEWLGTAEPLERVRAAWRAAAPVLAWLAAHVGPADPVAPRPRAASGAAAGRAAGQP